MKPGVNKIMIKVIKRWFVVLFIIALVTMFYSRILVGFFQHDEWQTFATEYSKDGRSLVEVVLGSFSPMASHFSPFFDLTFNLLFSLFGLNYLGYAIVSIALHLVSVLLVFLLVYLLTKKMLLTSLSALLFGLNTSSHQATSWVIADINTQGATIFGLLSLLSFGMFLQKQRKQRLFFVSSLFFLIISLMFKEITIAFFVILPGMLILFTSAEIKKKRIFYSSLVLGLGMLYLSFRLLMFFQPTSDSEFVVTKRQSFNEIAYNSVTFPAKIFTQSSIPTWQLLQASTLIASLLPESLSGKDGTTARGQFIENVVLQWIDFSVFALVLLLIFLIYKYRGKAPLKKMAIFSLAFVIINSFVYVLSPGRSGSIPVVDSRNIYLPAVGTSILLPLLVYIFVRGRAFWVVLLIAPLVFLHAYWLNIQLNSFAEIGTLRKNILEQIKKENPNLPDKVVFYTESDTPYYGLEEKTLPFETGLGQALLVSYQPTENFPREIFQGKFLRFITNQGYREVENRGFGYFRDFDLLQKTVGQYNLPLELVIGYTYRGRSSSLQNITVQTRERLRTSI